MIVMLPRWLLLALLSFLLSSSFLISSPSPSFAKKIRSRFVHTPPPSVSAKRSTKIEGQITGTDDIDYVEFRFRILGQGKTYKALRMQQKGKRFFVIIPGADVQAPGIEYYVVGIDFNQGQKLLAGSPALPQQFLVIAGAEADPDKPDPDKKDPDKPDPDKKEPEDPEKPATAKPGAGEALSDKQISTTTSRRAQAVHRAPGIVTVLTAKDIYQHGWRSLTEILRYGAGLDINDDGSWADIGMRGVNTPRSRGTRILFLLDGHDMGWRQLHQNFVSSAWIAVEDIERIEIVRGALTGLWGANAQSGVVHIITKRGASMNGIGATLGVSPISGSHFFNVRGGKRFASGVELYSTLSLNQTFRSPTLAPNYELGLLNDPIRFNNPNDSQLGQNFFSKISWNGLFLSVHQGRYETTAPLNPYSVLGGDDSRLITDRIILRIGWDGKLGNWGRLSLWGSYDRNQLSPSSSVTLNPFSSQTTSDRQRGRSNTVLLQRPNPNDPNARDAVGSFPVCNEQADDRLQCVLRRNVEVLDNENNTTRQDVCLLLTNKNADPTPFQQVTEAQRYQNWFPTEDCIQLGNNGRYQSALQAVDNRIQLGGQLTMQLAKGFHLMVGADFEYLISTLWHFPERWREDAVQADDRTSPDFTNYRLALWLQGQYAFNQLFEISAAVRLDLDERWGARFSPQAAFVINPGAGLFGKLHYGWGYRAPSLYEFFHFEGNRYGNPTLVNEEAHSVGLQIGWRRPKLLSVAVNGYASFFSNTIGYTTRSPQGDQLPPLDGADQLPYNNRPTEAYQQLQNSAQGFNSLGGEAEFRLFPIGGFELIASFGLFFATRTATDNQGQEFLERLTHSAGLTATLLATYRVRVFQKTDLIASLGLLYVGSKFTDPSAFRGVGTIPTRFLPDSTQPVNVPNWSQGQDPRGEFPQANGYVHLNLTLQLVNLFEHVDLVLRFNNLLGAAMPSYDAGDPFLYPHQGTEFMMWLRFRY